jgi:hypothetical protein
MSAITLDTARARLTQYLDAEAAVLSGQQYSFGQGDGFRSMRRADLAEIRKGIEYWTQQVENLSIGTSGNGRRSITPRPLW